MVHVGIGYDVHALVAGRKLILGGVEIPHTKGLDGHSDADALMHAICDAVLGALGEEDIGHFFPNTDPRWKGAPSKVFLAEAARQVAKRKGKIVNVDATVIAQAAQNLSAHCRDEEAHCRRARGFRKANRRESHHERKDGVRRTRGRHRRDGRGERGFAIMSTTDPESTVHNHCSVRELDTRLWTRNCGL